MKLFVTMILGCLLLQSCCYSGDCNDEGVDPIAVFSEYTPVILDRPTFETSVELQDSRAIAQSGKIYVLGELLFVNEVNEGFHVFDNADPTSPIPLSFIKAPGATDVAIKNNVYYINQAVDLIAVTYDKVSANLVVTKRIRDIFPVKISPDGYYPNVQEGSVVVDYNVN